MVRLEKTLAGLKTELEGMKPDAAADDGAKRVRTTSPNAVFEQLQLRLGDEESSVALLRRRSEEAAAELQRLETRRRAAPDMEAEYANLNRDYQILKKNYDELLERRESARLAQAVDDRRETMQFRVIEPAFVPAIPSWPNRRILSAVVFAFAIGCGIGAALLLTSLDDRFRSVEQLQEHFRLPILGGVTRVRGPSDQGRARRRTAVYATASVLLVAVFATDLALKPELGRVLPGLTAMIMDRLPASML